MDLVWLCGPVAAGVCIEGAMGTMIPSEDHAEPALSFSSPKMPGPAPLNAAPRELT